VGDFAFGEVAVEERSGEVAAVLVEFVDQGWEGGEEAREVAEVRVGGEGGVGLGFQVEECVNGGAGIGWGEEGERVGGCVKGFRSFFESVKES